MPHLRLFGPPALAVDANPEDSSAPQWMPLERKDAAWLAMLALDGPCPRDRLAAWLWPEVPLKTSAGSLRQRIFRLRKRTGHDWVLAAEMVQLQADVQTDAASGHAPETLLTVTGASAMLLAGLDYADCPEFSQWLQRQREHHRARRLDAMAAACARHEAAGELARAIELAQTLVTEEPLSEHALRRLMRLHYLRGDRAAALTAFERTERLLKDELGTRPGAETLALLATIEGATPASIPAASAPTTRRYVPASLHRPPRLIGRARELAELHAAWAAGRIFLVLGEAGMGKTRLLAEFAAADSGGRGTVAASDGPAPPLTVQARPGDAGVPFALLARLLRALRERRDVPTEEPQRRELARLLPELGSAPTLAAGEGQRLMVQRAVEWLLLRCAEGGSAPAGADGAAAGNAPVLADTASARANTQGPTHETVAGDVKYAPWFEKRAASNFATRGILLDDLHFADSASLEMLQALIASERLGVLRWGLAQRPGEGPPAAVSMREVLAESQRLHAVVLGPLDLAGMHELVASLGLPELESHELAEPLLKHTGGNPLFALETLKDRVLQGDANSPRLPQPATVGALIERRLKTLSPAAVALARVAAIAGVDFDVPMAEAVLKTPALALADAWAELEAAQVLTGGSFAHDLVFDAVLRGVPQEIARHVHEAVAEELARRAAEPARIAVHWQRAQRWTEAGRQFQAAASRARTAGRLSDTSDLWSEAAACYGAAGDRAARWACEAKGVEALAVASGPAAAIAVADRLLAEAQDERERIQAMARCGHAQLLAGNWQQAAMHAADAVRSAEQIGEPGLGLDAACVHATALSRLGQPVEAARHLVGLRETFARLGSPSQRLEYSGALSFAHHVADRLPECIAALHESVAVAREIGDLSEVATYLNNLAAVEATAGRAEKALAMARNSWSLSEQIGLGRGTHSSMTLSNIGLMATQVGEYRLALEALESGAELAVGLGTTWAATAENHLATLWLLLGQWHRAEPLLAKEGMDHGPATRCRRSTLRARLRRLRGSVPLDRVAAELREDRARLKGQAPARTLFGLALELSRVVGADEGLTLVREVRAQATAIGHLGVALHARMRETDLLLASDKRTAERLGRELEASDPDVSPTDAYVPELWWIAARAALASPARAARLAERGVQWMQNVLDHHLDPAFHAAFMQRNPVNRALTELHARLSAG